ncbi:hypothetical protein CKAN_02546200 [Cinnamomum micranthum f. kanehirae]|uniref:Uncharacterized protein n=1 Tax=Cinnamomum micranthum f. kanehirae TaxID=337451 RepID=A0A3S3R6F9_9MAGN|nr:hypothetical protein CKAN_02546200 [Cinnamomum micranthum f. kanehirae]
MLPTKSKDHSLQLDASFGKKPDSPSINLHSETSSENNDLLFKVKSNVLCTDLNPKKFNVPLITFSRRAKRHPVNTDAPKNVINEKRCSVVEWGNSAFTGSLHQRASQKCDSVDQSMAMVQKINTLLVPGQDRQVKIVCKEEDRNLRYSSSSCASKTKIGHCSDEEQETQGRKLVGSPVAEGVQEKNSDQCLPSLHSRADDNVQECHCPFKCRETSSTDMTNETKQLGCSVTHLEGSVTPGSLNPIVTEQSCFKLSTGVTRSEKGLYSANASSQSHPRVVHEKTSDRARVLDLMEIPEQIVQDASFNRTLNDENLCPSTREYGVKHEHTCNAKASSVLSKDMSVQDPHQQSLSTNILDEVVP